jgi:hypothetical protein
MGGVAPHEVVSPPLISVPKDCLVSNILVPSEKLFGLNKAEHILCNSFFVLYMPANCRPARHAQQRAADQDRYGTVYFYILILCLDTRSSSPCICFVPVRA